MRRMGMVIAAGVLALAAAVPQIGQAQGAVALYRAKGNLDFFAEPSQAQLTPRTVRGTAELTLAFVGDRPLGVRAPSRGVLSFTGKARGVHFPPNPCIGPDVIVGNASIAWSNGTSSAGSVLVAEPDPDVWKQQPLTIHIAILSGRFRGGALEIVATYPFGKPQCDAPFTGQALLL